MKVKIRNAFLHGVRYGARLARKQTRRDVEEIANELRVELGEPDDDDDVRYGRYQSLVALNPEELQD